MIIDINSNINKELLIYVLKNLINGTPPELISTDIEEEIFFPITIGDNDILYGAAYAYILVKDGNIIKQNSEFIGNTTNNTAEYQ